VDLSQIRQQQWYLLTKRRVDDSNFFRSLHRAASYQIQINFPSHQHWSNRWLVTCKVAIKVNAGFFLPLSFLVYNIKSRRLWPAGKLSIAHPLTCTYIFPPPIWWPGLFGCFSLFSNGTLLIVLIRPFHGSHDEIQPEKGGEKRG
jgi:hypothetical protein